jgi:hypothetical protein
MPSKPPSKDATPEVLLALGQAAKKADRDESDKRLEAVGDKALALGQKAMREGKAGVVTDGEGNLAIVER